MEDGVRAADLVRAPRFWTSPLSGTCVTVTRPVFLPRPAHEVVHARPRGWALGMPEVRQDDCRRRTARQVVSRNRGLRGSLPLGLWSADQPGLPWDQAGSGEGLSCGRVGCESPGRARVAVRRQVHCSSGRHRSRRAGAVVRKSAGQMVPVDRTSSCPCTRRAPRRQPDVRPLASAVAPRRCRSRCREWPARQRQDLHLARSRRREPTGRRPWRPSGVPGDKRPPPRHL